MMTTFSGAAVRSEISEAGKFSLDQYQRPSPAWRTWPSSARNASRSSAGAGPKTSPGSNGSSNVAARRWARRTWRLSGSSRASSGVPSRRNSGWRTTYWSTGAPEATSTATLVPLPPPGPPDLLPGRRRSSPDSRPGSTRRAGRCRRRARGRSCDDAEHLAVAQAALDRARARSAGSRRGSRGPGCAGRSSRGAPRAGRSARPRPRRASGRRRSSGARPAGTAGPSAGPGSGPIRARRSPGRAAAARRAGGGARRTARRCGRSSRLGRPVSSSASSAGFPIVAEQQTMTGCEP